MKAKITYFILSVMFFSFYPVQEASSQAWLRDIGQGVKNRAKDRAVQRVEEKIYETVDKSVDKAVDKAFESTEEAMEKAVDKAVSAAEKKVKEAADTLTAAAEAVAAAAEDLSVTVEEPAASSEVQTASGGRRNAEAMSKFLSRPSGGKPFYPIRKGISMTYANKDAKGKADSYTRNTITDISWKDERNFSVSMETELLDADMNTVTTPPMTSGASVENGIVTFDPESMAGQLMAGMEVSGDYFQLPDNIVVGDVLPDYTVIINISGMKTSSSNSNVRVTGRETLRVSGHEIDCYIVESTVAVSALGLKSEMTSKSWYGRGVGQVKQESYNKKGKLMSIYELVELKGF